MKVDEFIDIIPENLEYSLTIQKLGYRYFCFFKILNGPKSEELNGSSNDLGVALQLVADKLKTLTSKNKKSAKSDRRGING